MAHKTVSAEPRDIDAVTFFSDSYLGKLKFKDFFTHSKVAYG